MVPWRGVKHRNRHQAPSTPFHTLHPPPPSTAVAAVLEASLRPPPPPRTASSPPALLPLPPAALIGLSDSFSIRCASSQPPWTCRTSFGTDAHLLDGCGVSASWHDAHALPHTYTSAQVGLGANSTPLLFLRRTQPPADSAERGANRSQSKRFGTCRPSKKKRPKRRLKRNLRFESQGVDSE
jgi:hypothetical protein